MSLKEWERIRTSDVIISPSNTHLKSYTNHEVPTKGQSVIPVKCKGEEYRVRFYVVDGNVPTILGKNACEKMNLIKRIHAVKDGSILDEYPEVFKSIGCLPGSVKITLKMDAEPVIEACRNIPFQIAPQLKEVLERMVSLEIIEPVKEPTEWVNAMHVVVKPNKLRICLDPRNLNQAIRREHFKLPTREEISAKFANCQVYSKLDASKGFWQMKLDEESSKLCTFITPWGRFKYKRLPFGISCAPEIYHRTIYNMFAHLKGVESSMDDICIGAKTQDEHDQLLRQVLDICKENGHTLNQENVSQELRNLLFLVKFTAKTASNLIPRKSALS
jgi:hypothetical protein